MYTMDVVVDNPGPPQQIQQQQLQQLQNVSQPQPLLAVDPSLEEQELKTPKKRAETWVQDEIKLLIALRKEMDQLFNTSKSNKHLWEQISAKMKERGYERSATMCTDKWRNLLKEYKKAKHLDRGGSAKVACYKDLEELLGDRVKAQTPNKAAVPAVNKIEMSSKGNFRTILIFAFWSFTLHLHFYFLLLIGMQRTSLRVPLSFLVFM
jgi:hypothetical protein